MKKLDNFIKTEYNKFSDEYGKNGFDFIFWSDHGHIPIKNRVDLYEHFEQNKLDLKNIFHLVDSTTARFWVKNDLERESIMKIMDKIPEVTIVKESDYKKFHISNDKDLYGDMFYYLEGGTTFLYTIHGFGKTTKSMHGYHPEAEGNDGLFVSNKKITTPKVTLPDIFVTTIKSLGIKYDSKVELDGNNVLST